MKRYGIEYLKICGEKASADYDAAERYIDEFAKMVSDENFGHEHNETVLYWCYIPRKHKQWLTSNSNSKTMVTKTMMMTLIYPLLPETSCFVLLLHVSIFSCV